MSSCMPGNLLKLGLPGNRLLEWGMPETVKDSRGVQAYRWWMAVGTTAAVTLAGLILSTVQDTAKDITTLKVGFAGLSTTQIHQGARLEGIDRRNDDQDRRIDELRQRIYQTPASLPAPASNKSEEQQRQQWQRR